MVYQLFYTVCGQLRESAIDLFPPSGLCDAGKVPAAGKGESGIFKYEYNLSSFRFLLQYTAEVILRITSICTEVCPDLHLKRTLPTP